MVSVQKLFRDRDSLGCSIHYSEVFLHIQSISLALLLSCQTSELNFNGPFTHLRYCSRWTTSRICFWNLNFLAIESFWTIFQLKNSGKCFSKKLMVKKFKFPKQMNHNRGCTWVCYIPNIHCITQYYAYQGIFWKPGKISKFQLIRSTI